MWQGQFENCLLIEQDDWDNPDLGQWMTNLNLAIRQCVRAPVLIAHGLGCALVAHLATEPQPAWIAGALLVGPTDVNEITLPKGEASGFAPMPLATMPWPTSAVASSDDVNVTPERAQQFADAWGTHLTMIQGAGHFDAESGLGPWPEGRRVLAELVSRLPA